jgi:hypothetical protein
MDEQPYATAGVHFKVRNRILLGWGLQLVLGVQRFGKRLKDSVILSSISTVREACHYRQS